MPPGRMPRRMQLSGHTSRTLEGSGHCAPLCSRATECAKPRARASTKPSRQLLRPSAESPTPAPQETTWAAEHQCPAAQGYRQKDLRLIATNGVAGRVAGPGVLLHEPFGGPRPSRKSWSLSRNACRRLSQWFLIACLLPSALILKRQAKLFIGKRTRTVHWIYA